MKIFFYYFSTDVANEGYSIFRVAYMQPTFQETRQVKAYDFNDLVGNVGGYVGMFLGYAILNLSNGLFVILQTIKNCLLKPKISNNAAEMGDATENNDTKLNRKESQ